MFEFRTENGHRWFQLDFCLALLIFLYIIMSVHYVVVETLINSVTHLKQPVAPSVKGGQDGGVDVTAVNALEQQIWK